MRRGHGGRGAPTAEDRRPGPAVVLAGISVILILGIGAQWLAWRLRLPSILLLLSFGFLAGPVCWYATDRWFGRSVYLDPDAVFGRVLLPLVSVSVALILFEGGLSLSLREFSQVGRTWRSSGPITVGPVTTSTAPIRIESRASSPTIQ